MKKGIVMEIDDAFLLLLTPEGEFLRAKKQSQPYTIGEEIYFFPVGNVKTRPSLMSTKNLLKMKTVWGAAFAIIIFLGTFIPFYQNNKAYAYMSIDVNPSIELGVNKNMQVVELKGYNPEGKKVISQINHWKNQEACDVTKTILDEMQKEGYLKDHQQVILTTVRANQKEKSAEEKLSENIKEIKETANKDHLALKVQNGTEQDREKAHKLGITTGKYQESKNQTTKSEAKQQTNKPAIMQEKKPKVTAPANKKKSWTHGQEKKQNDNNNAVKKQHEDKEKPYQKNKKNSSAPGQVKKLQKNSTDSFQEVSIQKHKSSHHKLMGLKNDVYLWKSWNNIDSLKQWSTCKHHHESQHGDHPGHEKNGGKNKQHNN